ncbi:MAG: type IX secretion system membrane protein PorP/SprF [Bacteroidetes bacterium]|nr:type IX secretion system membrane protein PorP/SprF [Bacteroidota bacterium]
MKKLIPIVLGAVVCIPALVKAQQDPYYTHFAYNKVFLNPAYAGASGRFCINAVTHQQWRGFQEQTASYKTQSGLPISDNLLNQIAPKTTGFGFSAPINIKNAAKESINYGGVYLGFISDVVAYEVNTYMRGGVAGAYNMANGSSIRVGVDFTSLTKQLDGTKMRAHDPNDPRIPTTKSGATKTALGAGVFYNNPNFKDFYAGLSVSHMMPKEYQYQAPAGTVSITTARHFYLMSGLRINNFLGNPALSLDPALLVKTVMGGGPVKPQLDLQGMVTWNEMFAGGLALRNYGVGIDAASIMLGYYPPIKGNSPGPDAQQLLRVGYSYDITLQSLRRNSNGSHELQVNYCFKIALPVRPEKVYRHPRYMLRNPDLD